MTRSRRGPLLAASVVVIALLVLAVWWLYAPSETAPSVRQAAATALDSGTASPPARTQAPPPAAPEPATPTLRLPPAQVSADAAASFGAFLGRVVDAKSGAGIPGAEVTLAGPKGGAASVTTGADGTFDFRPEEAGAYQLAAARADGFVPFGPEWGRSPIALTAVPGQKVDGLVVALVPAPEVTATVQTKDGLKVPGAKAQLLSPRADEAVLFPLPDRFVSDANGTFRFRAAPGTRVQAQHPKYGAAEAEVDEQALSTLSLTLTLAPGEPGFNARLRGRVLLPDGGGAAGALVVASSAARAYPKTWGPGEGARAVADEEGRFVIEGLEKGSYDVAAFSPGLGPARLENVSAPKDGLTLKLQSGAALEGTVRTQAGAPIPAFGVDLRWMKGPLEQLDSGQGTFVDPQGHYRMQGLVPGRYVVHVFASGFVPQDRVVEVPDGASTVQADFALEQGGTLRGTVLTEGTRAPIAGANVSIEGLSGTAALSPDFNALTDAAGQFTLEGIRTSGVSLLVSAKGHNSRVVSGVTPGPVEILLSEAAPDAGLKTELVGIGAVLRARDDALVIGMVIPGGGAAEAKLVPGDEVVSIDGTAVVDIGFEGAIGRIRGEPGTQVVLGVRKAGKPPAQDVTVVRRKIGA